MIKICILNLYIPLLAVTCNVFSAMASLSQHYKGIGKGTIDVLYLEFCRPVAVRKGGKDLHKVLVRNKKMVRVEFNVNRIICVSNIQFK